MWNLLDIEKKLNTKGYAIFKLLTAEEVKEINLFFRTSPLNEIFTTHAISDINHKVKVDEFLKSKFEKFNLPTHNPFWGNFMYKKPFGENMQLHADWSYVDESKYKSYNVWSPLIDTNLKNGCLWIVPFSQQIVSSFRGVGLPRFYENEQELLKKRYAIPLKLKKGEAVIYDHRVIHFSNPNYSSKGRPAITMIYLPKNITYKHFYQNSKNQILEYEFKKSDFLLNLDFFKEPKKESVRYHNQESIVGYSKKEVEEKLKKVNLFQQLRNYRELKKLIEFIQHASN